MKPKVSIGVCAKNAEENICEALESILTQDFPHELMELILVDDGSKDRTLLIMGDYASKMDMAVKVYHHEWRGLGITRNVVVDNAQGEYVIWVDADMVLSPDFVRKQVDFMERNPQVGIARGKYVCCPINLVTTLRYLEYTVAYSKFNGKKSERLPGMGGTISRLNVLRQVSGFDIDIKGAGEDHDIAYRVGQTGWLVYFVTDAEFYANQEITLKELWDKYFWHGRGEFFVHAKNSETYSLVKLMPLSGFLLGLLFLSTAYHLTRRLSSFLLPFLLAFETTAWSSGFFKSQIETYLHKMPN